MSEISRISDSTPQLCKLNPAGQDFITDLNDVGGIQAVMAELNKKDLIEVEALTIDGTVSSRIASLKGADGKVIHSVDAPYALDGGLAVLTGNLAPDGSVVKKGAVLPEMLQHEGPARVFDKKKYRRLFQSDDPSRRCGGHSF